MRHLFNKICIYTALGLATISCGSDNEPSNEEAEVKLSKQTILMYAVASNNLYNNLLDDKNEMLEAIKDMNINGLNLLVYEVTNYGGAKLSEAVKDADGECTFNEIASYDRNIYSTDPQRIKAVISDVISMRPAESYGLLFWSHGTGIDVTTSTHPTLSTRAVAAESDTDYTVVPGMTSIELKPVGSFGSDNNPDGNSRYYDEINIDELAKAIPDNVFHFIWFDACYMAGIETIYQMRNKCKYYVGYPTEVFTPGMPYHLTIPYLLRETPDLVGAAKAFFNYYVEYPVANLRVATVAVTDMSKIEPLAEFCEAAYSSDYVATTSGLQCYTRAGVGPFYDFGQYTHQIATQNAGSPDISEFEEALDEFVMWSATTEKDFNFRPINTENLSVISCWLHDPASTSEKSRYFKTLDWYKRVYPQK